VIPTADAGLSAVLERHAQHLLEQLPPVHDFVARVRRLIAEELLEIAEVACSLGFSEPNAFHRAFRRWTGRRPSDYREQRGYG
jgi:hypothetical protein